MQYVKIPEERIAVLIGENGSTKREIEKITETKITVDDTSVSIDGEAIREWVAKDVVRAIGRGFSPEKSRMLLNDNTALYVIDLEDEVGTERAVMRVKGRIIGERGKSRRVIEELTDTHVSVYGKTVSIIGKYEDADTAKEAVLMLASGARHSTVYKFLERSRSVGKLR